MSDAKLDRDKPWCNVSVDRRRLPGQLRGGVQRNQQKQEQRQDGFPSAARRGCISGGGGLRRGGSREFGGCRCLFEQGGGPVPQQVRLAESTKPAGSTGWPQGRRH